jgi:hypothetical protein
MPVRDVAKAQDVCISPKLLLMMIGNEQNMRVPAGFEPATTR